MKSIYYIRNKKGFTLIEMLSAMIIIGVMGSVAVKKVDFMTDTACAKALAIAVKELNVRESLVWSKTKISDDGYTTDEDLLAVVPKNWTMC
jgi:prepilin-type N-terminal cleavage/methylation domain-containing protein